MEEQKYKFNGKQLIIDYKLPEDWLTDFNIMKSNNFLGYVDDYQSNDQFSDSTVIDYHKESNSVKLEYHHLDYPEKTCTKWININLIEERALEKIQKKYNEIINKQINTIYKDLYLYSKDDNRLISVYFNKCFFDTEVYFHFSDLLSKRHHYVKINAEKHNDIVVIDFSDLFTSNDFVIVNTERELFDIFLYYYKDLLDDIFNTTNPLYDRKHNELYSILANGKYYKMEYNIESRPLTKEDTLKKNLKYYENLNFDEFFTSLISYKLLFYMEYEDEQKLIIDRFLKQYNETAIKLPESEKYTIVETKIEKTGKKTTYKSGELIGEYEYLNDMSDDILSYFEEIGIEFTSDNYNGSEYIIYNKSNLPENCTYNTERREYNDDEYFLWV